MALGSAAASEPDEVGLGVAREHEPAEEVRRRSGKSDRVCVPRDSRRAVRRAHERACSRRGGSPPRRRSAPSPRARAAARSRLSALRTTPASRVMIRCSSSRIGTPRRA